MVLQVLQKVFRKPTYVIIALLISIGMFVFATWLPNIGLIMSIVFSPDMPFSEKLYLPVSLIGSIATNFNLLSASYTVAIAILFGIDLAVVIYYLRRRIKEAKNIGISVGFFGVLSGVVGMGCAACGSFLLTSGLSLFGASWLLFYLPVVAGEFAIMGVILLIISIYLTARKIKNPAVCKI